jgi:hypothetical protein
MTNNAGGARNVSTRQMVTMKQKMFCPYTSLNNIGGELKYYAKTLNL